ncbi:MAG: tRNA (adenosine(37)-N6)-dimethylallyltransferase MiaA [Pseudomonadota bacterium]|nr:tRNA (adenosine(37)-N6)-dimethylallyltransferase MiaA [Pseudomonadota bacterium]
MEYIALLGPTGVGKTQILLDLNQQFPNVFEVVSVDSVQVFKHMNIGSAKPSQEELAKLPHHLIDVVMPHEHYDVALFCQQAAHAIQIIRKKGKLPILCGGTMLYMKSFIQGLSSMPQVSGTAKEIVLGYFNQGLSYAWSCLYQWDPLSAGHINRHDKQRIQRALEVYVETGMPLSTWHEHHKSPVFPKQDSHGLILGLLPKNRDQIKSRIEKRFLNMIHKGLIEECQNIIESSPVRLNLNHPSMRAIGYRQVYDFILGNIDKQTMIDKAVVATRQYAKRQFTWLRNWTVPTQYIESPDEAKRLLADRIRRYLSAHHVPSVSDRSTVV